MLHNAGQVRKILERKDEHLRKSVAVAQAKLDAAVEAARQCSADEMEAERQRVLRLRRELALAQEALAVYGGNEQQQQAALVNHQLVKGPPPFTPPTSPPPALGHGCCPLPARLPPSGNCLGEQRVGIPAFFSGELIGQLCCRWPVM